MKFFVFRLCGWLASFDGAVLHCWLGHPHRQGAGETFYAAGKLVSIFFSLIMHTVRWKGNILHCQCRADCMFYSVQVAFNLVRLFEIDIFWQGYYTNYLQFMKKIKSKKEKVRKNKKSERGIKREGRRKK